MDRRDVLRFGVALGASSLLETLACRTHRPMAGGSGERTTASMRIIVSSASGANGNGRGELLAFDLNGQFLGPFTQNAGIVDPRGLHLHPDGKHLYVANGDDRVLLLDAQGAVVASTAPMPQLNPGGVVCSPDGRCCVTARTFRTIVAFAADLGGPGMQLLPRDVVEFPRGFAFKSENSLFLAAGATGSSKSGAGIIYAISSAPERRKSPFVEDADLSPLDLTIAPNGNIVANSEVPFGAPDAVTSVREYDVRTGTLARVFRPDDTVRYRQPRGVRIAPDGRLFCVTRDEVVAFDFESGKMLGAVVRFDQLHGQALAFFPP